MALEMSEKNIEKSVKFQAFHDEHIEKALKHATPPLECRKWIQDKHG